MKHFIALILAGFGFFFLACRGEKPASPSTDSLPKTQQADSNTFVIAVLPTLDALPFYYADSRGLFRNANMRVRLTTFKATADADTALLRGHADLAQTDLVRVAFYRKNKLPIKAYLATDGLMALIVYSKLRINDIKTLRRRLVGIARHSASDYWSAEALKKADMDYNAIFRPQINDLALRASMLNEGQIEAAFLPEPYVTSARIAGHTVLFTSPENHAMGCWAIMEGKAKEQSRSTALEAVIRGYNMAVDSINIQGKAACRPLLTDIYGLKPEVIDSLHLPHYNHAKEPVQENLDAAKSFISSHK